VFVGENSASNAASFKRFEQFLRSGQQGNSVEHVFVPVRAVNGGGFLELSDVFFTKNATDGDFDAAADRAMNLFHRRLGQPECPHGVDMGAVDRSEVIQKSAIEVEENGAETIHARNIGESTATENGKF
jgi:hypothetical protein